MKRLVLAAAALFALAAVAGFARPEGAVAVDRAAPETSLQGSVTVTGSASVSAVPTRAQLSFGVESQGATAKAALAANGTEMRRVIDALRRAGARDVSTQYVSLGVRYGEEMRVQSYVATNSVSATIDVSRAGALIDAAVDAGANQVYGPTLTQSEQAKLYRQALEGAVKDARGRAEILAAAAGGKLGRVTSISESSYQPGPVFEAQKAVADASTPIEAGPQETTATVSVTFALD